MRGFEQAGGIGGSRHVAERFGLPVTAPDVQTALMLCAYRATHHKSNIQVAHWEQNDEATQSAAMDEWVGDPENTNSLATLYRSYAEEHPYVYIDIRNDDALHKILMELENTKKKH